MYCGSSYGPSFGGGRDLGLHYGGDTGQSYTALPNGYTDTLGRGSATFTGAENFTAEDYEVWAVN
jgi:hypothetical protein